MAFDGRRDFRAGRALVVIAIACTAVFTAGAVWTHRDRGWTWVSVALACMAALSIGGVVEALIVRIQLTDDAMIVTDLRGRRHYPKTDIERIAEAKGSPPAILLRDGRWIKLPPAGVHLGNSVRGWLRQTRSSPVETERP